MNHQKGTLCCCIMTVLSLSLCWHMKMNYAYQQYVQNVSFLSSNVINLGCIYGMTTYLFWGIFDRYTKIKTGLNDLIFWLYIFCIQLFFWNTIYNILPQSWQTTIYIHLGKSERWEEQTKNIVLLYTIHVYVFKLYGGNRAKGYVIRKYVLPLYHVWERFDISV